MDIISIIMASSDVTDGGAAEYGTQDVHHAQYGNDQAAKYNTNHVATAAQVKGIARNHNSKRNPSGAIDAVIGLPDLDKFGK